MFLWPEATNNICLPQTSSVARKLLCERQLRWWWILRSRPALFPWPTGLKGPGKVGGDDFHIFSTKELGSKNTELCSSMILPRGPYTPWSPFCRQCPAAIANGLSKGPLRNYRPLGLAQAIYFYTRSFLMTRGIYSYTQLIHHWSRSHQASSKWTSLQLFACQT